MTLILSGTDGLSDVDGSAATPAIRGTDANTGIFFGADIIGFAEGGAEVARFNADAQFVAAAGTASLPVITTTGDVNTGIFFPAADTIAFSEGGVESMRIDSSGRLLVGLTSTNADIGGKLQVEGTSDAFSSLVRYSSTAAGNPAFYLARSKSATLGTNTIVASGDALGNIIFAGANGTGYSDAAYIQAFVDGTPGASADMPGRLVFSTSADGSATPTERMRIDSSGNLLVGTTSTGYTDSRLVLSLDNSTKWVTGPGAGIATRFYVSASGSGGVYLNGTSATSWTAISDERFKSELLPIENATEKVVSLRAVTGVLTLDESKTRKAFLMAQDVLAVLPEAVDTTNPEQLGLAYTDVIPLLVAAIKEQQALITTLTDRITALEAK